MRCLSLILHLQVLVWGTLFASASASDAAILIDTVAGGIPSNVSATAVALGKPNALAMDNTGNFLFITSSHHVVVKVNLRTKILTHIAGNGTEGFSGDGGLAISGQLSNPGGVAVDLEGNVYIADRGNFRIRKVDGKTGVISTLVGTGKSGYSGDAGPAILAQLAALTDIAVYRSQYLYVADESSHRLRQVDLQTGLISTIAGTGKRGTRGKEGPAIQAQLDKPEGLALDQWGNLFFIDGSKIFRISKKYGILTKVAGGNRWRSSIDTALEDSTDLTVDRVGRLLIANARHHRVQRLSGLTTRLRLMTIAGVGPGIQTYSKDWWFPTFASLNNPVGVVVDSDGNLFIADQDNFRILLVDITTGLSETFAGNGRKGFSGDNGGASIAQLHFPRAVAVDSEENLFIADTWNHCIRRMDGKTRIITTVAGMGKQGFSGDGGLAIMAELDAPGSVAVDGMGNLFFVDWNNRRVRRVDATTGIIATIAGKGSKREIHGPSGVTVDSMGNLFIADSSVSWGTRIYRIDARTKILETIAGNGRRGFSGDGGLATEAELNLLVFGHVGMAVDRNGHLYFADGSNFRIRRVDAITGIISTVAGFGYFEKRGTARIGNSRTNLSLPKGAVKDPGGSLATTIQLGLPVGLAIDDSEGSIYFTDSNRILSIDNTTGALTLIGGKGKPGFSGDEGPAINAEFAYPHGLAVDPKGNLYVVDTDNNRIRQLTPK